MAHIVFLLLVYVVYDALHSGIILTKFSPFWTCNVFYCWYITSRCDLDLWPFDSETRNITIVRHESPMWQMDCQREWPYSTLKITCCTQSVYEQQMWPMIKRYCTPLLLFSSTNHFDLSLWFWPLTILVIDRPQSCVIYNFCMSVRW